MQTTNSITVNVHHIQPARVDIQDTGTVTVDTAGETYSGVTLYFDDKAQAIGWLQATAAKVFEL